MSSVLRADKMKSKTAELHVGNGGSPAKAIDSDPLKDAAIGQHMGEVESRPKNLKANVLPTDGYGLEVDGKIKTRYDTAEAATKAGLELRRKYPQIQIKVFDAKEQTRTAVELPEQT